MNILNRENKIIKFQQRRSNFLNNSNQNVIQIRIKFSNRKAMVNLCFTILVAMLFQASAFSVNLMTTTRDVSITSSWMKDGDAETADSSKQDNLASLISGFDKPAKKANPIVFGGDYDKTLTREKVKNYINNNLVVVFSFSACPFCTKAKGIFNDKRTEYKVVEFDKMDDGSALRAELSDILGGRTSVPAIFVDGEFIGGCNDGGKGGLVPLDETGELDILLKKVGAIS